MVEGQDFGGQKGSGKGNVADGVLHTFKDEMLDPNAMWTREVASQIAGRIAQDVQQHDAESDKDLIKIAKSLNSRDDVTATSNVNQALNDLGFPKIMVGTTDGPDGGRATEITSKSNGIAVTTTDRWYDEKTPRGADTSGHEVTQRKRPTILH